MVRVNWTDLVDRQLQTATGAPFTVVRVSATHIAVRPKGSRRDYALSIPRELEPAVGVYAAGNLPAPAELRRLGVRPVLTSYAWGILKAVVQDRIGVRTVLRAKVKDFVGTWVVSGVEDMGDEDWRSESEVAFIRLEAPRGSGGLSGEYEIGLSSGRIDGDLREFGSELVVVFGYEGLDEMDPASGGGWLQLLDNATLEGEFIGALGRFTAKRQGAGTQHGKQPARGWRINLR